MQESTGVIKELTKNEQSELLGKITKEISTDELNKVEETDLTLNSLDGLTPLTEEEHSYMLELPEHARPSELVWMRDQVKMTKDDFATSTPYEMFMQGFRAARKLYEVRK